MTSATPGLGHGGRKEWKRGIKIQQTQALHQALGWVLYPARGQNFGEDVGSGVDEGRRWPTTYFPMYPKDGIQLKVQSIQIGCGQELLMENEGC